jgi:parallel beta-helix repeat protein
MQRGTWELLEPCIMMTGIGILLCASSSKAEPCVCSEKELKLTECEMPAETYYLQCSGNPALAGNPALVLRDNQKVDLHGFTLRCADTASVGVSIEGSSATLHNGGVEDCLTGVQLRGSKHAVTDITVSGAAEYGFDIEGDGHQIYGTIAESNMSHGYRISGNDNILKNNTAQDNEGRGFLMSGSRNAFSANHAIRNAAGGIWLGDVETLTDVSQADANEVVENEVVGNENFGLSLFGRNNIVKDNNFRENGIGLSNFDGAGELGTENEIFSNDFVNNVFDVMAGRWMEGRIWMPTATDLSWEWINPFVLYIIQSGDMLYMVEMDEPFMHIRGRHVEFVMHSEGQCNRNHWNANNFRTAFPKCIN